MSSCSRALLLVVALALSVVEAASAETLCGGELVDALQFVCEDRGFYFSTSRALLQLYDFFFFLFFFFLSFFNVSFTSPTKCPPPLPPSLPLAPRCFVRAQTVWIADSPSVPPPPPAPKPPFMFHTHSHSVRDARRERFQPSCASPRKSSSLVGPAECASPASHTAPYLALIAYERPASCEGTHDSARHNGPLVYQ